ncbi:MAG: STAS domain-containing protein [Clostridia bacterium]|nr:STAS domain-containing protein [Clostridia bacterium]MBQ9919970.1 STAS domain-containing protein [Clostridia bacterium]
MKEFTPMLFTTLKGYNGGKLVKDIVAGIIVAIIALPLSIALAIASGVGPEEGLYTAIIAGALISIFGGSKVQIAGPTAAFATIVAGVVAANGMEGLALATIVAGLLLVLMGIFKLGSLIKFIPYTITTGFTAGIAVTILIGQLKDFFGVSFGGKSPIEAPEKIAVFFENISTLNWWAVLVGAVSLLILILWPKLSKKIPASFIAVVVGAVMVMLLPESAGVQTIKSTFGELSSKLPSLNLPKMDLTLLRNVLPDAFTIAILAAIESLLSCVVADGMTGSKHRSNMELIAQGIGNVGSALFGGIPATGAIARTAANINNGGKTPISGVVHAIVLLLILVFLMPYAALIPMPTIAAILFQVAYNMSQWKPIVRLVKTAPKSDILVLALTFTLTVVFDLVVAIGVGIVFACILFMKRMSEETNVYSWKYEQDEDDSYKLADVPKEVRVFEISGPLFFGMTDRVANITTKEYTKCLIIRMRSVPSVDATALNALEELCDKCKAKGITVIFSHLNEQPMQSFKKAGFIQKLGEENFRPHIDDALEYAKSLCEKG